MSRRNNIENLMWIFMGPPGVVLGLVEKYIFMTILVGGQEKIILRT